MINLEDQFGKQLPEELLQPYEKHAREFVNIATEQIEMLYPNIKLSIVNKTNMDITVGSQARKTLDSDDPEIKKLLDIERVIPQ